MPIRTTSKSNISRGVFYMEVYEELTIHSISKEHENLMAICQGLSELHLDFSGLLEIDTTGIQLLLSLEQWAKSNNKILTMSLPSQAMIKVLETYNLHSQFNFTSP